MTPQLLWWIITSALGAGYTGRNLFDSIADVRVARAGGAALRLLMARTGRRVQAAYLIVFAINLMIGIVAASGTHGAVGMYAVEYGLILANVVLLVAAYVTRRGRRQLLDALSSEVEER